MRRLWEAFHVWIKLIACLALLTWAAETWFVPRWIVPRYRTDGPTLHLQRSWVGLTFDLVPARRGPGEARIVLVGDSSMASVGGVWGGAVGPPLAKRLRAGLPNRKVDVIDVSIIGAYATDALLLVAKSLASDVDLVVYGMSPRVVPRRPEHPWATQATDVAFDAGVPSRVGLGRLAAWIPPTDLARALAQSAWPLLRMRGELNEALWTLLPGQGLPLVMLNLASQPGAVRAGPVENRGRPLYPAHAYGIDPKALTTRALEALIALCGREERCLLYHVPVNPDADGGFEPGLVEHFVETVRARTAEANVPFADFHAAATPAQFMPARPPDALHLSRAGAERFAPGLAERIVATLREAHR